LNGSAASPLLLCHVNNGDEIFLIFTISSASIAEVEITAEASTFNAENLLLLGLVISLLGFVIWLLALVIIIGRQL